MIIHKFDQTRPPINLTPRPFKLNTSPKGYHYGQHKAISPEKTIQQALSNFNNIKKALLKTITRLDHLDRLGIPAYTCEVDTEIKRAIGLTDTFGKGVTPEQAQASAFMELVERYSAASFLNDAEQFLIARHNDIKDYTPSPQTFLSSFENYHDSPPDMLNEICASPLNWTWSYSLTQAKPVLFPLKWFSFIYGTTGFAAGNTLEEAIIQALCEVVERHAVSTVVIQKLPTPAIDPDSINHSIVQELISKFHRAGISIYIRDFSLGIQIPTVEVLAFDPEAAVSTVRIYNAAGTHMDKNIALIRALTEVAQHRCQIIKREIIQKKPGGPTYCFPKFHHLGQADYLIDNSSVISFDNLPNVSTNDFKSEIELAVSALRQIGMEVFVTNITHPNLGIPAVIVSIPGAKLNRPVTQKSPYFVLARSYMEMDQYREAIKLLKKAFEIEPAEKNNPAMLCRMGICYRRVGLHNEAAQLFQQALELKPELIFSPPFIKDFSEIMQHL